MHSRPANAAILVERHFLSFESDDAIAHTVEHCLVRYPSDLHRGHLVSSVENLVIRDASRHVCIVCTHLEREKENNRERGGGKEEGRRRTALCARVRKRKLYGYARTKVESCI